MEGEIKGRFFKILGGFEKGFLFNFGKYIIYLFFIKSR